MKIIELSKVFVKGDQKHRLSNINMSICSGEKIALIGANGAGKSSLISAINGTLKVDMGNATWHGSDLSKLKPRQRLQIATIWQDLRLIEELNVIQNINSGALGYHNFIWSLLNIFSPIESDLCLSYLEAVQLPKELLYKPLKELSGGQLKRVALRQKANLLLADEPIANLDQILLKEIIELLTGKKKSNSIIIPETVLISIHDTNLINSFTRVIGLYEGEIIIDKPTNELDLSELNSLYH